MRRESLELSWELPQCLTSPWVHQHLMSACWKSASNSSHRTSGILGSRPTRLRRGRKPCGSQPVFGCNVAHHLLRYFALLRFSSYYSEVLKIREPPNLQVSSSFVQISLYFFCFSAFAARLRYSATGVAYCDPALPACRRVQEPCSIEEELCFSSSVFARAAYRRKTFKAVRRRADNLSCLAQQISRKTAFSKDYYPLNGFIKVPVPAMTSATQCQRVIWLVALGIGRLRWAISVFEFGPRMINGKSGARLRYRGNNILTVRESTKCPAAGGAALCQKHIVRSANGLLTLSFSPAV